MIQEPLTSASSAPSGRARIKLKVCYCAIAAAVLTQLVMMIVLLSIESSTGHWSSSGLTYCVVEASDTLKIVDGHAGTVEGHPFTPRFFNDALEAGCTLVGGVSVYYLPSGRAGEETTAIDYAQAMMCPKDLAKSVGCMGA